MRKITIGVYKINELGEQGRRKAIQQVAEELNDVFWNDIYDLELEKYAKEFQNKYGVVFDPKDMIIDTDSQTYKCWGLKDEETDIYDLCHAAKIDKGIIKLLTAYSDEYTLFADSFETNFYVYFSDTNYEIPKCVHTEMEKLSQVLTQFLNQKFERLAETITEYQKEYTSDEACIKYANDNGYEFFANGTML